MEFSPLLSLLCVFLIYVSQMAALRYPGPWHQADSGYYSFRAYNDTTIEYEPDYAIRVLCADKKCGEFVTVYGFSDCPDDGSYGTHVFLRLCSAGHYYLGNYVFIDTGIQRVGPLVAAEMEKWNGPFERPRPRHPEKYPHVTTTKEKEEEKKEAPTAVETDDD